MKKHVLLLSLLFANLATADFDQAMQWYEEQSYDQAYAEFTRLAHIGNHRAQYNLAVMYLHGQHVDTDLVQAYAWASLAQDPEHPEFKPIINTLTAQLSATELQAAEQASNALSSQYGPAAIAQKWAPIEQQQTTDKTDQTSTFDLKIVARKPPRYPNAALLNRVQGWVTVGFYVHPDGTVRQPHVIDAYPPEVFDKATLDVVQQFKFSLNFKPDAESRPVFARQTIEYSLENLTNRSELRRLYENRLQKLKTQAQAGSAQAQYLFAMAASSNLMNETAKISRFEVNDWLFKAATNGHAKAQYLLGRNMLCGAGTAIDRNKASNWVVLAAEQGHAGAARLAYDLFRHDSHLNQTGQPAEYWLKQAALDGDANAQIAYASHLVEQEPRSTEDIELARQLLEDHEGQRKPSVNWYQTSALVYQAAGEPKKAQKHQKKANKLAKKLGWDLSL
ncbi:TonB family protein [Marinicella meishanensis]|uniref:TonB family protein n=1 Tax=Marinicella meishanensis TaxID=2873263 RepID=UPI001CBCBEFD|nr:TonB family protein [Marinicella sp. NBU2979]